MEKTKVRALYDELVVENAVTGEAVRHVRKAWRGSNPGRVVVNIIIVGMALLLYFATMMSIVRWDLTITPYIQIVELLVVTLVAPAAVYAAVSGEREKATWDALVLTRLTPAQIIAGKLVWRMALIVGIMALMLVMVLVSQTQGIASERITAAGVVAAQLLILAWGFLLSTFGLWVSARTSRSVTSIGVILASVLGVLLMLPMLLAAFGSNLDSTNVHGFMDAVGAAVTVVNPFVLVALIGARGIPSFPLPTNSSWGLAVAGLYLMVSILFLWRTHVIVKRLSGE